MAMFICNASLREALASALVGARGHRDGGVDVVGADEGPMYLAERGPRPVAIRTLAETLERTTVCWRDGTKGKLEAEFACSACAVYARGGYT